MKDDTTVAATGSSDCHFTDEKPGDRIGRYKLLQKIGQGGMGSVWLAEQTEPVHRQVALKVIKQGLETTTVLGRFEAERQALALMDHPNIAKVLDGGATPTGRPFFVMELVKGIPLTQYCDERQLSIRERLELFVPVCQAIQHAHQKGVIHRDIKPSNVMVALFDGRPVPKVIDFGVAKATGQRLTERTLFTEFGAIIGTPEYMSPEQAELNQLDVDTRSDIYSLGVLLYELLTGTTPLTREALRAGAFDEILRRIRQEEPPRPSTRLSQSKERLASVSALRHLEPAKLTRLLRGDLDWIAMKALEKDRARRYETANGLARDIERYLENEEVQARPPSNLYRFQKIVRRNKAAFAAAALITVSLLAGFAVSTVLYLKEKDARRRADTEANRSRQAFRFLDDMFNGFKDRGDTVVLREALDKTSERIDRDLAKEPLVEAEIRNLLGNGYKDLGLYNRAFENHSKALRIRKELLGPAHPQLANSMNNLGTVLQAQGKFKEAEDIHRQTLEMRRKLYGKEHADIALSMENLAVVLDDESKLPEAERLHREAIDMQRRLLGSDDPEVAMSLSNLGNVFREEGRFADAEKAYREAAAIQRKRLGDFHRDLADTLVNLGNILSEQGKEQESETVHRECLAIRKKVLPPDHPDIAESYNNLGVTLRNQNRLADAETLFRQGLEIRTNHFGTNHYLVATSLDNIGGVLRMQGKPAEAEPFHLQALCIRTNRLGPNHPRVAVTLNNLANAVGDQGRFAEAEALFGRALEIYKMRKADDHPEVAETLNNLATVLWNEGKLAEAEDAIRRAIAILIKSFTAENAIVATMQYNLAGILQDEDHLAEADTTIHSALATQRKLLTNEHLNVANSLDRLCLILCQQQKYADAEAAQQEALKIRQKLLPANDPDIADSLTAQACCYLVQKKYTPSEPLARQSLSILETNLPNSLLTVTARAILGESLLGQQKQREAEALLSAAYSGLKDNEDKLPANLRTRLQGNFQRVLEMYRAAGQTQKATDYQIALDRLRIGGVRASADASGVLKNKR